MDDGPEFGGRQDSTAGLRVAIDDCAEQTIPASSDPPRLQLQIHGFGQGRRGMTMNPLNWSREHQIALCVVALIGAALATVLGYLVYAAGWGEGAVPFGNWLGRLFDGAIWWALFGAVIGGAIIFVRNLLHSPMISPAVVRGDRPIAEAPAHRLPGRTQERAQVRTPDRT